LMELKQNHVIRNLRRIQQKQREMILASSRLSEIERYDLKCFAPPIKIKLKNA
jgi:hypothetical protein